MKALLRYIASMIARPRTVYVPSRGWIPQGDLTELDRLERDELFRRDRRGPAK